ncbi:hypothetical protein [Pedobacter sp. UBA4863]|uniref:hypothetical protein n=1 Tax=Pedobacter sp. UBA4863 TaxID=1947060 RepID=UPI0025E99DF7|nr:hypothetical protein [Pedobacter sp. UBA4863]
MTKSKALFTFLALLLFISSTYAQKVKVDYKSNIISVDGKEIAKVVKIKDKENFGLTSTFELLSLSGEKLIIAVVATDFTSEDGNADFYYRFSFLPTKQTGIFSLGKLSTEKNFVKLIGESGMVVDNMLDEAKVNEFLAKKGKNPKVEISYDLVRRNQMGKALIKDQTKEIDQGNVIIGMFEHIGRTPDMDTYRFKLPSGLVVATASFSGGNEGKNFRVSTNKDRVTRTIPMKTGYGKVFAASEGMDSNRYALEFIAHWLINNGYL